MKRLFIINLIFFILLAINGKEDEVVQVRQADKSASGFVVHHDFLSAEAVPTSPIYESDNDNPVNTVSETLTLFKLKYLYRTHHNICSRYYPNFGSSFIDRISVTFHELDIPPPFFG